MDHTPSARFPTSPHLKKAGHLQRLPQQTSAPTTRRYVVVCVGAYLSKGIFAMKTLFQSLLYLSLLAMPLLSQAGTKIAGIELADTYQLGGKSLALNGAGVRSKFFFKIYVGALYTGKTSNNAAELIAAPGPKSMQMTMLYKEVEAKKITSGWTEGFKANVAESEFKQLEKRLQMFNAFFPALRAGDSVHMDYSPETGTKLSINGKALGTIQGEDFFGALLKVWLGDHPADDGLKEGLLGK